MVQKNDPSSSLAGKFGDKVKDIVFERVLDRETLIKYWEPLLHRLFPDKTDWESRAELLDRLADPSRNHFVLMRDKTHAGNGKGTPMGMMLLQVDPEIPGSSYIPWAGVDKSYRGGGLFPELLEHAKQQMGQKKVDYVLYECEDPARVHVAYDEEPGGPNATMAGRRLNFYLRETQSVIVDFPYKRPASDNDQNVQAYDKMMIKVLNPKAESLKGEFSEDGQSISVQAYRKFYLEMTRLQYGNLPEQELKDTLPAVKEHLAEIDALSQKWIPCHSNKNLPARTPKKFDSTLRGDMVGSEIALEV
jgi:hypothetical protein